jgi:hypothetical protein
LTALGERFDLILEDALRIEVVDPTGGAGKVKYWKYGSQTQRSQTLPSESP